jgi:hypothetical protein
VVSIGGWFPMGLRKPLDFIWVVWSGLILFYFIFRSKSRQWAYSTVVPMVSCGGPLVFLWRFFGLFLGRLDGY